MSSKIRTKRILSFVSYLHENPSEYYEACPSEDNISIWYAKVKNLSDEYKGGEYLLKIKFPEEYPFKAPDYEVLTPSGRFEINSKLCFSNTGFHGETWSAMWGIDQILMGLVSYFYERKSQGIGHIATTTVADRTKFAKDSVSYNQRKHNDILLALKEFTDGDIKK